MTISISLVVHPDSDKTMLREVFTRLDKWHPLSIRKYDSSEEAVQTLGKIFNPNRSVNLNVGQVFLGISKLPQIPDLVIAWGEEESLPDNLSDFLHFAIYSEVDEEYFMDIIELLKVQVYKPLDPQPPRDYELKKHLDKRRDWMFYEIQRPFNEPPFTTIVKSFSRRGIEPLFGQLFVSKAWGLLKSDMDFLEALWKFEFKDVPFDMTSILQKHADALVPSKNGLPQEYPDVFRKSIVDLLNLVEFYFFLLKVNVPSLISLSSTSWHILWYLHRSSYP